jgi:hypothetical protein
LQVSVKYETVLNMTTAKALGLDVPTSILLSADEDRMMGWMALAASGCQTAV